MSHLRRCKTAHGSPGSVLGQDLVRATGIHARACMRACVHVPHMHPLHKRLGDFKQFPFYDYPLTNSVTC